MLNIKKILNRLPSPIKTLIIGLHSKWNSEIIWDKQLIEDLSNFYNLNHEETICMLKLGRKLFNEQCQIYIDNRRNILDLYKISQPYNVFSLSYWHMQRWHKKFRNNVLKYSTGKILDYGGGIGDISLILSQNGLDVTYADINGKNMEFAKWLFKKNILEIAVFDVENEFELIWEKKYDTIICLDVIEHVYNPKELLEKMTSNLNKNGRLIITQLNCEGPDETAQMHFKINFDAEKFLTKRGLVKSNKYDWLWIKSNY